MNISNVASDMLPRTLYVGNLSLGVDEGLLTTLFNNLGAGNIVMNCKMVYEQASDPYCFIEFIDHHAAALALSIMNKRLLLDKEMKVNWATSPGQTVKQDTSQHHHIFIGDLSPEIETDLLRNAFSPFGEISDCRVVRDPQTNKSKGYGFVSFVKKADAENAISTMNGQWLGNRAIRTNWATRKPQQSQKQAPAAEKALTFEEVFNLSSPTNCTVYCGGINGLSEEMIRNTFEPYGTIKEMRVFKDKGYSFIRFESKDMATNAIYSLNNTEINGHILKCSWGKEMREGNPSQQTQSLPPQAAQQPTAEGGNIAGHYTGYQGYWLPGYPVPNQYVPQSFGQYGVVPVSWPQSTMAPNSQYPPNYGYRMP